MSRKDRLEPESDGFVAFHSESGERWRHKDVEDAVTGPGYRRFLAESGEERRYYFGAKEPHDATLHDLRRQLVAASRVTSGSTDAHDSEASAS